MLNYVEHTYGVRGEFEAAYAIFHDVDSARLDEFSEMNDNSYCLSRPFTRLVKKKISLCEQQDSQIYFFHSILDTVSSSATPQPVHLNVKNGKHRGNRASRTNSNTGGGTVRACVKRIFTRAEQTNKRVIRDDSLFPPLLLLL